MAITILASVPLSSIYQPCFWLCFPNTISLKANGAIDKFPGQYCGGTVFALPLYKDGASVYKMWPFYIWAKCYAKGMSYTHLKMPIEYVEAISRQFNYNWHVCYSLLNMLIWFVGDYIM